MLYLLPKPHIRTQQITLRVISKNLNHEFCTEEESGGEPRTSFLWDIIQFPEIVLQNDTFPINIFRIYKRVICINRVHYEILPIGLFAKRSLELLLAETPAHITTESVDRQRQR